MRCFFREVLLPFSKNLATHDSNGVVPTRRDCSTVASRKNLKAFLFSRGRGGGGGAYPRILLKVIYQPVKPTSPPTPPEDTSIGGAVTHPNVDVVPDTEFETQGGERNK